jgi:hypothetical protein
LLLGSFQNDTASTGTVTSPGTAGAACPPSLPTVEAMPRPAIGYRDPMRTGDDGLGA